MAAHERLLFAKLASACHPVLPAEVRMAAMDTLTAQPKLCSDGLLDFNDGKATLRAVLDSESRELVALLTPLFAVHRFQGESLLAQRDALGWNGRPCKEVGTLLLTTTGMNAQSIFAFLMVRYGDGSHSKPFQSLIDSLLLVDDGSWVPQGPASQQFFANILARTLPVWDGKKARTLYQERARTSVSADVWTSLLYDRPDSNRMGALIRSATWLVWGTSASLPIFQKGLGLSAHAAMGLVDVLPDWETLRGKPQYAVERELIPFLNHLKTLKNVETSV